MRHARARTLDTVALVACFHQGVASAADTALAVLMEQQIDVCRGSLNEAYRYAWISLAIAATIALLGFVLAQLDKRTAWMGRVALVLSGLLASLTFVNTNVFPETHTGLFEACSRGARAIRSAERYLLETPIPPEPSLEEKAAHMKAFNAILSECDNLHKGVRPLQLPFGVREAGAGIVQSLDEGPKWLRDTPSSEKVIFFIGSAHDASLATAQSEAVKNAHQQIEEYLLGIVSRSLKRDAPPSGSWSAVRQLANAATGAGVADTYIRFDKEAKLYSYYILLRLNRAEVQRLVTLWLAQEGAADATRAGQAAANAPGPTAGYQRRRQETYARLLDLTRQDLPPDQYEAFLSAREQRKGKEGLTTAVTQFESLVAAHPDLYFGWFNLGLAYRLLNQVDDADKAFKRAVEVETSRNLKDPSLYSTYGVFLVKEGRYSEAEKALVRALELEPEHPYAKRYLRLARREQADPPPMASDGTDNDRSEAFR